MVRKRELDSFWITPPKWGCSSAGRAPALHAGGQEFEPLHLHHDCLRKQRVKIVRMAGQGTTSDLKNSDQCGLIAQVVRAHA